MDGISVRLANIMANHGFLRKREMHPIEYKWMPFEPLTRDEIEASAKLFYAHCMEHLPAEEPRVGPFYYSSYALRPGGPRWMRIPNMGKGTILELANLAGIKHQEYKTCFGVLVPAKLYDRLRGMAIAGQIRSD